MKNLTVIVATRKSLYLEKCINSLAKQKVEIIVFLNGTKEEMSVSRKRLLGFKVKLIKAGWFNFAKVVNQGVKFASKSNVAFIDDNLVVSDNWSDGIISYLKEHNIVSGTVWFVPGKPKISLYFSKMWNRDENTHNHLLDPNLAFRKSFAKKILPLDEHINSYTWDLYQRLTNMGIKVFHPQDVPVIHLPEASLIKIIKSYFYYGVNQKKFFKKYKKIHQPYTAVKNLILFLPLTIYDTIVYKDLMFAIFYRSLRVVKSLGFLSS